jgi:ribonuclease HI
MEPIHSLVHEDQAGFIPRRSIFNQIRLARSIISYAEVANEDGAIIALDQEKAYDKIRHDYLWKTLENFNIPQTFIKTVKALYLHAHTRVAINGVLSEPFHVTRGVRQGDPLSCALFDLAIEPLACSIRNDPHLTGLVIPGLPQNILVTMFADDTTLFLNKDDKFDDAQRVLNLWCKVSGAKFNIGKTEIIPIGSADHRTTVTTTRKINPLDHSPFNEHIHIANEGEAIRSLGAWIGNNVNDLTPWETVLDKIHKALNRWRKMHPTLHGRKTIIQAVVGGHTQFLTKAQGMPRKIQEALTKIIRDFIWEDDSSPRISIDILYRPIEEGGLNLLDVKSRNDAIEIVWLKSYLDLSPSRPKWARVTDLLLIPAAPVGVARNALTNPFLQTWNPRHTTLKNKDTIRMLDAAKRHNANLAAIRMSPHLRNQLPAWYHLYAEKKPLTSRTAKCLRTNHAVTTVADLVSTSARLRTPNQLLPHTPSPQCLCSECTRDRSNKCRNPHACAEDALSRIHLIVSKLNPIEHGDTHDSLSLTPSRKARNQTARENNEAVLFDPSITNKENLGECFRIFAKPEQISNLPARRYYTQGINLRHREVTVYTDGACIRNGKLNAQCGSGVWFGPDHEKNNALRPPGPHQSNQVGEIAAIIAALDSVPKFWPLKIISDSKYAINGLTTHLHTWEDNGWIGIKNAAYFKRATYLLRSRTATTSFLWTKGHAGTIGNEESDQLAKEGAEKPNASAISLEIPKEFDLQGAKLATITQSTAYQGIRAQIPPPPRATTAENLELARTAIANYNGNLETNEAIWRGTRSRSIRTKIKQFLFKAMHGTQKMGKFWSRLPGVDASGQQLSQRQFCKTCNVVETMEHALVHCNATPIREIWSLTENLWPYAPDLWPEISLGLILGCGSTSPPEPDPLPGQIIPHRGIAPRGATRLLQILISEAAYLIWVLRCERSIQNRTHLVSEVQTRWLNTINKRLTEDKILATKIKRNEKSTQTTKDTWEHVLKNQGDLPHDWIASREVLVGMGPRRALPP